MTIFLFIIGLGYMFVLLKSVKSNPQGFTFSITTSIVAMITNFFDFFGIGSYAPQTIYLSSKVKNEDLYLLPPTLNIGNYIPIVVQAIIAITIIEVDFITLFSLPIMALLGAYFGSKFIKSKNVKIIKIVMVIALLVSGILLFFNALNIGPFAYIDTQMFGLSDTPVKFAIALVIFFGLGFLQSFGIGLYAPGFALLGLLGLNHLAIMPINMMSCIFLSAGNSMTFLKEQNYLKSEVILTTIFGSIGVVFAGILASFIDLSAVIVYLQLGVCVMVIVTSIRFFLK